MPDPKGNNKTNKKHRNKVKTKKRAVNTKFVDKVFTQSRVNTDLIAKGLHTEGNLRGTVNTAVKTGGNNQMIDTTT